MTLAQDWQEVLSRPVPVPVAGSVVNVRSGAGGLALGFQLGGFEVLAAIDEQPQAIATVTANLPLPARCFDIADIDGLVDYLSQIDPKRQAGIITTLTTRKLQKRRQGNRLTWVGVRNQYLDQLVSLVTHYRVPFFLADSLQLSLRNDLIEEAQAMLAELGYHSEKIVFDSSYFGVAQRSQRVIIVGSQDLGFTERFRTYFATYCQAERTSMQDWFGHQLGTDFIYRHQRNYRRKAVFSISQPAPTLWGCGRSLPMNYPGNRLDDGPSYLARSFSFAEQVALQTFPDDYQFLARLKQQQWLLAEATPPKLAMIYANSLKQRPW